MQSATRRAAIVTVLGGIALMLAAIDGYVHADHGVIKKSDRLRTEITLACNEVIATDAKTPCETLGKSTARIEPGVTYVTEAFQDGNATTLVKIRLEK